MKTLFERMSEAQSMTNTPSPDEDRELIERVARALSAQHSKVTGRTTGPDFHWKLFEDQAIVAIDTVLNRSTDRG